MNCRRIACLFLLPVLAACAMNDNERDANQSRFNAWRDVNRARVHKQTEITGIEVISGHNMTITTWGETTPVQAPAIQYDTSDTELAKKALGVAGTVATGALVVEGIRASGAALRPDPPTVVTQPPPLVVRPEVVRPEIVQPGTAAP